eukprot:2873788-Prymnesium_polylepis.2
MAYGHEHEARRLVHCVRGVVSTTANGSAREHTPRGGRGRDSLSVWRDIVVCRSQGCSKVCGSLCGTSHAPHTPSSRWRNGNSVGLRAGRRGRVGDVWQALATEAEGLASSTNAIAGPFADHTRRTATSAAAAGCCDYALGAAVTRPARQCTTAAAATTSARDCATSALVIGHDTATTNAAHASTAAEPGRRANGATRFATCD